MKGNQITRFKQHCNIRHDSNIPTPMSKKMEFAYSSGDEETHSASTEAEYYRDMSEKYRKQLKWIIHPSNKWLKRWDMLVFCLLVMILFTIPYQLGVSAGYYTFKYFWWFLVMLFIDIVFFMDTILHFFRIYRDSDTGILVINRRKICMHYLKSDFFLNFLSSASFPSVVLRLVYQQAQHLRIQVEQGFSHDNNIFLHTSAIEYEETISNQRWDKLGLVLLLYGIRLFRLNRIRQIFRTSIIFRTFLESRHAKPHRIDLMKNVLFLYLVSHWFACFWCSIVFFQTHSFGNEIIYHNNWMSQWYNSTYDFNQPLSETNLIPIGWERDIDRYILSLFWTIQTITSIGYGDITPCSKVEWIFSCMFMLLSGVLWALIIGSFLNIVVHMMAQKVPLSKLHDANTLIEKFGKYDIKQPSESDKHLREDITSRIKRYILDQRERRYLFGRCTSTIGDEYAIYNSLSVELQQLSSYLILKPFIEMVPYLSSKYLSIKEQSFVASNCQFHCFSAGDVVSFGSQCSNYKRGIFIILEGVGFQKSHSKKDENTKLLIMEKMFGLEDVLIERTDCTYMTRIIFSTFTKMLFIPREIVLEVLETNIMAWKQCARWKYLHILLRQKFAPQLLPGLRDDDFITTKNSWENWEDHEVVVVK